MDSPYQTTIYDFIETDHRSLVVEAAAGSGKTTTLCECARRIPRSKSCLVLAFNKDIDTELSVRLPPHIQHATFHSHCKRQLDQTLGRVKVDANKCKWLLKDNVSEKDFFRYVGFVTRLASFAKSTGYAVLADAPSLHDLMRHHNLFLDEGDEDEAIEHTRQVLVKSNSDLGRIDFDDMLYLPLLRNVAFAKFNYIFVDEAQDTNAVQRAIIRKMLPTKTSTASCFSNSDVTSRLIAVGDPHQCHPTGTLIDTKFGRRPIEQLKVGDLLIGYHRDKTHFRERRLEDVSSRDFHGNLLVIQTQNNKLKVTPNHRCFVRMHKTQHYALYAMQQGNRVRVGITQLFQRDKNGFGPSLRARQEQADAAWVLAVFKTREEALINEKAIGARFGVSDITFRNSGLVATPQHVLDEAWLLIGDCNERLETLLTHFGREVAYPVWTKTTNTHWGVKSFVTEACNLIPEVMEVAQRDRENDALLWQGFGLGFRVYHGPVWSLQVEPDPVTQRRLYVAENLVTHNSIYGFRGADASAMDLLKEEFACETLPLSVSYRCSQAVVAEAQKYL